MRSVFKVPRTTCVSCVPRVPPGVRGCLCALLLLCTACIPHARKTCVGPLHLESLVRWVLLRTRSCCAAALAAWSSSSRHCHASPARHHTADSLGVCDRPDTLGDQVSGDTACAPGGVAGLRAPQNMVQPGCTLPHTWCADRPMCTSRVLSFCPFHAASSGPSVFLAKASRSAHVNTIVRAAPPPAPPLPTAAQTCTAASAEPQQAPLHIPPGCPSQ